MAYEKLARRYADAVFALSSAANVIDQVAYELRDLATLFDGSAELRHFFHSPMMDRPDKITCVLASLEGRVHEITLHTILLLVHKRREIILDALVDAYDAVVRASRGREVLRITSARPLGNNELEALVSRVGAAYKSNFEVRQDLDPRLIGGVRLQTGDRRVDGSIAGRIEDLAAHLFSTS